MRLAGVGGLLLCRSSRLFLLVLVSLASLASDVTGVVVYRLGRPFSAAERDSLHDLSIGFEEVPWSFSQLEEGLELDSLTVGSLQPNYFQEDENIATTALSRGGWISTYFNRENSLVGQVLLDGDPDTVHGWGEVHPGALGTHAVRARVTVDLGGRFRVKKVKFRPLPEHPGRFLEGFRIGVTNDPFSTFQIPFLPAALIQKPGDPAPALEISQNTDPDVTVLLYPPDGVETRYIQLTAHRTTPKAIELAEFEVYGGGFVNQAAYLTDVIQLDDMASWGSITWSGTVDPRARIEIRTRTGADPHPEIFWETRPEQQDSIKHRLGGGDLSAVEYRASYDRLPDVFKPVDEHNRVTLDTENWSFWSSPYEFSEPGADLISPSSRRFIQLGADFSSTADDAGKIDYMEFKASVPPAVREIVGEIYPVETRIGEVTRFTYYIKPTLRAGDQGFDSLEIVTPAGFASVDSLRLEGIDQAGFHWTPNRDGRGFEVRLPGRLGTGDSGAVVEVVFRAPVLREVGNFFDGKVFDSTRPLEVRQRIEPGNAADEVESDLLAVRTVLSRSLLFSPRVLPRTVTPNGDAVNDVASITYTLLRVTAPVPVSVRIYDLSGALVKQVYAGDDPVGEYTRRWDGTDATNHLVAPGIYLYRIRVDLQVETETASGPISVVY